MKRIHIREAPARFERTVEGEVRFGVTWPDYRHRLSPYLLPQPGATAAEAAILRARRHEVDMDAIVTHDRPGEPPPWPHWTGVRRREATDADR